MPTISKQSNRVTSTTARTPTTKVVSSGDVWGLVNSIHMLLYGESGTGKTTLASTFPAPILWLVCSGGNKPGELKSIDTPENRKRITPRIISASVDLEGYLQEAPNYATVVLDHASGYADLKIKEIIGADKVPISKYRRAGKGESWSLVSQQQYGQLAVECKEFFRDLLNLACNVVIIAQQRTFGGKEDGVDSELIKPTVGAALTPSVTGWLNPACDAVFQTFKRQKFVEVERKVGQQTVVTRERASGVEYCLRIGPHEIYQTKARIPLERVNSMDEIMVNPTYDKIVEVV